MPGVLKMNTCKGQRSIPWNDDEFIIVDGFKLVYSIVARDSIVVHFPGCWSATVADLLKGGFRVSLPVRLRQKGEFA